MLDVGDSAGLSQYSSQRAAARTTKPVGSHEKPERYVAYNRDILGITFESASPAKKHETH